LERNFEYSKERQTQKNLGPTPEGLYSINRSAFIESKNEGGSQQWSNLSWYEKAAASVGRSSWPGGTSSWGEYRWKLQNEGAETFGRDNFYMHGGSLWGSRGCIDLGAGVTEFYKSFMGNNHGGDKVFLKVQYPQDMNVKIQNMPTSVGLKILK
jgi:hypothetical protein